MKRKLISAILALCMVIGMLPMVVFATEATGLSVTTKALDTPASGQVILTISGGLDGYEGSTYYYKVYPSGTAAVVPNEGTSFTSEDEIAQAGWTVYRPQPGQSGIEIAAANGSVIVAIFVVYTEDLDGNVTYDVSKVGKSEATNDSASGTVPPTPTPPVEEEKITIKFVANGGTGEMSDVKISETDENAKYAVPSCSFTAPEGKEFGGWSASEDGAGLLEPGEEMEIKFWDVLADNGVVTLTAVWKDISAVEEQYTIKFAGGGASGTMEDKTVAKAEDGSTKYTIPASTFDAPEGKEFDIWTVSGEGLSIADGILTIDSTVETTNPITLTATWKPLTVDSADVTLKSLKISNGTLDFAEDTLVYYVTVNNTVETVNVEAVPTASEGVTLSYKINNVSVEASALTGITLTPGATTAVEITVTDNEDSTNTKTYAVNISRAPNDATKLTCTTAKVENVDGVVKVTVNGKNGCYYTVRIAGTKPIYFSVQAGTNGEASFVVPIDSSLLIFETTKELSFTSGGVVDGWTHAYVQMDVSSD